MATESRSPARTETADRPTAARRSWDPFLDLRQQIDRVFEDFFPGFPGSALSGAGAMAGPFFRHVEVSPVVDVAETDNALTITAELPGMAQDDVEITLADGILTLRGEKKAEAEEKEKNYYLLERSYGAFSRSFRLPPTVDQEKCEAKFDKGVLRITLPKTEAARSQVRKIDVQSG